MPAPRPVHIPRGNAFTFHVGLDPDRVLGRMLDHPRVLAVGIPDPRRGPTRSVPSGELSRSREFDTASTWERAPRFNLTGIDPHTYRLAALYGVRPGGERVVTLRLHPEDGGCVVICNVARFAGPADAATALGRGLLSGVLVTMAVFVEPGTVIGGLLWQGWEGSRRLFRRLRGMDDPAAPAEPPPPAAREALVSLLGELFTPVARASAEAGPTPFRDDAEGS